MKHKRGEQSQAYAVAREPYKQMYPQARMHHLFPRSRNGPDREFNLFPWNEASHDAWHFLFPHMTIREVWPLLPDIHLLVFGPGEDLMMREWCLPLRYHLELSEQRGMVKPRSRAELQVAWTRCFGSSSLIAGQRFLRYMMLFMIFGRHADDSVVVFKSARLRAMLQSLQGEPERQWAFRTCFKCLPHVAQLRLIKRAIRSIRNRVRALPIH